jgi:hypothetical protein
MKLGYVCGCALALVAASPAAATPVFESGDAGDSLATAQVLNGTVTSISGSLGTLRYGSDDIDMYKFFIGDTANFAVTVDADLSRNNDAQMFLFDSLGHLVLSSDDTSYYNLLPKFAAGSLAGKAAGDYYLAFDLYNTDPKFTNGVLSGWDHDPRPMQTGDYTLTLKGTAGAVPEPATWAMMLVGFGAVGFAMRRRKNVNTKIQFA